jgi:ribosomal silencing factor RsfS
MSALPQQAPDPTPARPLLSQALDLCNPYVVGVFDLSDRGGPERTMVVKARSAAHLRKLATRLADMMAATPEGDAPDGSEPWVVVDGGEVVTHLLTEASLSHYGLLDLFGEQGRIPDSVFAKALLERVESLRSA